MPGSRRHHVLGALLVIVGLVAAYLLRGVLWTVFLAITVAYILFPLRRFLTHRGLGPRIAAGLSTLFAFVAGLLLFAPLVSVLYFRRRELFAFLRELPESVDISIGEFAYTVDVATFVVQSRQVIERVALDIARASPALALKLMLFTLIVYGLLLRPTAARVALLRPVPPAYHDVVQAFHDRTKSILYAIYVLQAAVAFVTFLVALVVFWALGYEAVFTLAVIAGFLQFIPIVGPSLLVAVLALLEIMAGNAPQAILVFVVGVIVVGFLPDAVVRPQLASITSGMPGTLYFVGFVGGVLSIGVVGFIAGPVVVALLVEGVSLLADESASTQKQLS